MRVSPFQVRRLKRWFIPGAALSLAGFAITLLVITELALHHTEPERILGAPRRVGSPTGARVRVDRVPSAGARTPTGSPGSLPAGARGTLLGTSNGPSQVPSDPALAALYEPGTLTERLARIDELLQGKSPDEAVRLLSKLFDSRLPGSVYDERTLRLTVLARIGLVPGAMSEAILIGSTEPNRIRPERLIAIEFLSGRSEAARARLQTIADTDTDPVVQKKARWALARGAK